MSGPVTAFVQHFGMLYEAIVLSKKKLNEQCQNHNVNSLFVSYNSLVYVASLEAV